MKPSEALALNRDRLRAIVGRYRTTNLRVFGPVVRGEDREDGDLDLLVDTLPGATLLDLGGLQTDLEDLLGVPIYLVTSKGLSIKYRGRVLAEAQPV